jgi:hypothetical protein
MRRRVFWLLTLAALAWLWLRRGARRPEPVVDIRPGRDQSEEPVVPPGGDPADELRRKLDETKGRVDAAAQESASGSEQAAEELDAKRREVYDRAESAADEMRRSSAD